MPEPSSGADYIWARLTEQIRLNMRANLKGILSAVGAAALLASPAMGKTVRDRHVAAGRLHPERCPRGCIGHSKTGRIRQALLHGSSIAISRLAVEVKGASV
jgi:hypothetical protein